MLGSGFGAVLRDRIDGHTIAYKKIDGMPLPGVAGHAGEAHVGTLHGRRVVAFSGRFHLYEGRATDDVIYPGRRRGARRREDVRADERRRRREPRTTGPAI